MPRPSKNADLSDYASRVDLATFNLDHFANDPALLHIYADFITEVKHMSGHAEGSSYVTVKRPKRDDELKAALEAAQRTWDRNDERYRNVRLAFNNGELDELTPKWQTYEAPTLRNHAEAEGYEVFALIAKEGK